MPGSGRAAKTRFEALEEWLGERDFGKQDERLPVLTEAFGNGFEIDFTDAASIQSSG